jgi:hypothetical protein
MLSPRPGALHKKRRCPEAPPSLGRKRPRKQTAQLSLHCCDAQPSKPVVRVQVGFRSAASYCLDSPALGDYQTLQAKFIEKRPHPASKSGVFFSARRSDRLRHRTVEQLQLARDARRVPMRRDRLPDRLVGDLAVEHGLINLRQVMPRSRQHGDEFLPTPGGYACLSSSAKALWVGASRGNTELVVYQECPTSCGSSVHNQEVGLAIIGAVGSQKTEQLKRAGACMPGLPQKPPPECRRARQFLQDQQIHLSLVHLERVVT